MVEFTDTTSNPTAVMIILRNATLAEITMLSAVGLFEHAFFAVMIFWDVHFRVDFWKELGIDFVNDIVLPKFKKGTEILLIAINDYLRKNLLPRCGF